MSMYTKPMTDADYEKWLEMMGEPTAEDLKRIQVVLEKGKQR
jgi:hypothetical protein